MQPLNILLCEDERIFALKLKERLTKLGHNVVAVASDAYNALKAAKEFAPDLALMDIHLEGGILGTQVAEALAEDHRIPSIFLTAYADEETLDNARKTRPLGYLVKPVRDHDLQMAIEFGYSQFRSQQVIQRELQDYRKFLEGTGHLNSEDIKNYVASFPRSQTRLEALNDVVGGMAHHMNNALTVMYAYLEFLTHCNTVYEFEQRHVRGALSACERQKNLVQQLLWASQRGAKSLSPVVVKDLVEQVITSAKLYAPQHVTFDVQIEGNSESAYLDEKAVTASVREVIMNAIEAVTKSGSVTITLREEQVDAPEQYNLRAFPGMFHVITVKDTGGGFSAENLSRAFEPFFTTQHARNAMGLGLAVARGVLESHSGWITIDSKPENGTCVQMYIPADNKQMQH